MKHGLTSGTMAQIATVLAKEYGVRVRLGGNNAYTSKVDDKWVINMPAIATDDPFYTDIMRCYLDHEAGHVRFSDMDLLMSIAQGLDYVRKSVWNIFEDIYVERKMSRSFPGCARNLRQGVECIFANNYELPDDLSVMVLDYILFKARHTVTNARVFEDKIGLLDAAMPAELTDLLDKYISRAPSCNSTKETLNLTEDLCKEIEDVIKNAMNNADDSGSGDTESGEGIQVEASDGSGSAKDDSQSSGAGAGSKDDAELGDVPQEASSQSNKSNSNSGAGAAGMGDGLTLEEFLESLVGSLSGSGSDKQSYDMNDRVNELIDNKNLDVYDGHRGTTGGNNIWSVRKGDSLKDLIGTYLNRLNDKSLADAQKESAKLASQLAGLLQTVVMNRGGFATRGHLDPRRLARVAVGRPDIFSSRIEKNGLDTEVIIALDVSGSMGMSDYRRMALGAGAKDKIDVANEAVFSILTALKGIQGVRSMAYAYSSAITHLCEFDGNFSRNSYMFTHPTGGTPTGEAVQYAMTKFTAQAKRKILVLITDGEPDNRTYFRESVRMAKRCGIEVVGVGIMDDSLLRDMNEDECFIVQELKQLAPQLFRILRNKLLRRA